MNSVTVALIGNPNTGKSSLFNALCGMRTRVGNFPGVTVEKKIGTFVYGEKKVTVIDLPGTYSLSSRSKDELVSVDALMGEAVDIPPVDAIVIVVDANHLERDLYLLSQIAELDKPMLLVLNMWDRVEQSARKIDVDSLSRRLGMPVIKTTACRQIGIDEAREKIGKLAIVPPRRIDEELFPAAFLTEAHRLTHWIHGQGHLVRHYIVERLLIDVQGAMEKRWTSKPRLAQLQQQLDASRERLKAADCQVPFVETRVRHAWVQKTLEGVVDSQSGFRQR